MLFPSLIGVTLFIAGASAGSKLDANIYLDTVLRDHLAVNARSLDPVSIQAFKVKVNSTGLTNRDLKAEFKPGALYGLSSTIWRKGDCGVPRWQAPNITVNCNVSLDGLRLKVNGSATGFDIIGSKKNVSFDLIVDKTKAIVVVTGLLGRPAVLKTLTATTVNFQINMNKSLNLNIERQKKFEKAISESAEKLFLEVLYGPFRSTLNRSVGQVPLPKP